MYTLLSTKQFERSFRRLKRSGKLSAAAEKRLASAIDMLLSGKPLPQAFRDHSLSGELAMYRECHIRGDLLLVYQRRETELVLVLVDVGSHAQLFG